MKNQDNILINFGLRVKKLRIEKQLSQESFGDLCEMDRTYISGIERGVRNISLLAINKIAIGLGVTISELFADNEPKQNS